MAIVKREESPQQMQVAMDPAAVIQAIVDKGITSESVSVMKDLIAMQREMRAESAKASFSAAFAELRRECGKILATKIIPTNNGAVKGRFAPLTEIQDHIEPLLEKHGFFMTFDQQRVEGGMTRVECVVVHRDGHEMRSGFTCREHQSPQNSAAQNDGGTNTLAKRIALCNMFGIRIDYETDARAEGDTISGEQAAELQRRAEQVYGGDPEKIARLLKFAQATTWENIRQAKYVQAMRELAREGGQGDKAAPPQDSIPPCPDDPQAWLEGMQARCADIGKTPSETTKTLSATFKKYGATSHLGMTAENRQKVWANAHARPSSGNAD